MLMKAKIKVNPGRFRVMFLVPFLILGFQLNSQELQLEIPRSHQEGLTSLFLAPENQHLFSGGKEGVIYGWDKASGKKIQVLSKHLGSVEVLKGFDNQLISSGREEDIYLWDTNIGQLNTRLKGHKYYVEALAINEHKQLLVSGSRDNSIKIWCLQEGKQKSYLEGHEDNVISVAIHPDGDLIASSAERHNLRIWNIQTQKIVEEKIGEIDIKCLSFSPDGQYLIGVLGKKMLVWEVGSWEVKYHLRGHNAPINAISFYPGTSILTSIDYNGKVIFWDLPKGKLLRSFIPGPAKLTALSFSSDGKELALGFEQGLIQLWNIEGVVKGKI